MFDGHLLSGVLIYPIAIIYRFSLSGKVSGFTDVPFLFKEISVLRKYYSRT